MKILIIGGGSSLARVLMPMLAEFAEVCVTTRSEGRGGLDLLWPEERLVLPAGVDVVINMAAHFGGRDFASMLAAERVNAEGTLKLCQSCQNAGVRHLVHLSTTYVMLAEDSPFYGAYALSKRHGEELAALYCRVAGLPLTILRPSQVYGAGDASRKHQPLFYHVIDRTVANEDIQFYGSNDALRNFIHAEDVAQAVVRVIRGRIEGIYACASLLNVRCTEIAQAAISAFNSTSRITFVADQPDIADNPFAADDILYQKLGWFPAISLETGMRKEVARRNKDARG